MSPADVVIVEWCARYLEQLETELVKHNFDMIIGEVEAPTAWAERLRALIRRDTKY